MILPGVGNVSEKSRMSHESKNKNAECIQVTPSLDMHQGDLEGSYGVRELANKFS